MFMRVLIVSGLIMMTTVSGVMAQPADNFYTWANHDWLQKTDMPADQPRVDNFTFLEDKVYDQIKELLADLKNASQRTADEEKIVKLYDGFMNMDRRNALGLQPIAGELELIGKIMNHGEVADTFARFQINGIASPLMCVPETDFKDSGKVIAFVAQAGLGIDRDYYLDSDARSEQQRKLYREYLIKLFTLASIDNPEARVDSVMSTEKKLAAIQWSRVENRDPVKTYNPYMSAAFKTLSRKFYGERIISALGVPADAKFNVMQPGYVKKFSSLFSRITVTEWKDYLSARLLCAYAGMLTEDFKQAQVAYEKALGLYAQEKPRWKEGIDFLNGNANFLIGRAYVEKYFDPQVKASVLDLIASIREEFKASITAAQWLHESTRLKALEKLAKMEFQVGYPDKWRDYSELNIEGEDVVENYKRMSLFEHQRNMNKIGQPVDKSDWGYAPQDINAFYNPTSNSFVLLAAILQEPFYDRKGDKANNYGGIGFVIGHEIGHGFDDQGSQFDGDGNLHDWWAKEDVLAYNTIKMKLIDQANAYEILPGVFLNGNLEIGEIMGDLSGAQIALNAYLKAVAGESEEQKVKIRKFFIQLAQTWRSKWRNEFLLQVLQTDGHPPSEFRSNGIVKQFDEFYQVFDVTPSDKMFLAPEKRVLLWSAKAGDAR
jgi:putative endopeptidase